MWSLGKVVGTPEACRIYLGSFWDAPLRLTDNKVLLDREKRDLLDEMASLPGMLKSKSKLKGLWVYFSILVMSCFMWSAALDSSDLLL